MGKVGCDIWEKWVRWAKLQKTDSNVIYGTTVTNGTRRRSLAAAPSAAPAALSSARSAASAFSARRSTWSGTAWQSGCIEMIRSGRFFRKHSLKKENVRYGKSGVRHMGEMGAVGETQKNKIKM